MSQFLHNSFCLFVLSFIIKIIFLGVHDSNYDVAFNQWWHKPLAYWRAISQIIKKYQKFRQIFKSFSFILFFMFHRLKYSKGELFSSRSTQRELNRKSLYYDSDYIKYVFNTYNFWILPLRNLTIKRLFITFFFSPLFFCYDLKKDKFTVKLLLALIFFVLFFSSC